MTEETNWEKIYDYFLVIFYTIAIAVTSGFGTLFLLTAWANDPILKATFWSYVSSTGFATVFLLSELQNKKKKYEEDDN